ncbi:iron ABC transporter permease [Bacillus sp. JJ664]
MQRRFIQRFLNKNIFFIPSFVLLLLFILGVSIGSTSIPFYSIIQSFSDAFFKTTFVPDDIQTIVMNIRVPRVLLAGLVGACLSLAGVAFQGILKNPLADPFTLGVSSGASVGAVFVLFFQISLPIVTYFTLPVVSILFGFFTLLLLIVFVRKLDRSLNVETLILGGIIISSFCSALLSLFITFSDNELRSVIGWLMGNIGGRGIQYSITLLPFLILSFLILFSQNRQLDAMTFGSTNAKHIGINVKKVTYLILFTGSILSGAAVAVSGTIGFVGLVVPHFTRAIVGPLHRKLLPLAMINGAIFLIGSDIISRVILAPRELPIGVITSLIGAPIFAIILLQLKRNRGKL